MPLVEDDPDGQRRYEGEHLPPLVVLDSQLRAREGRRIAATSST